MANSCHFVTLCSACHIKETYLGAKKNVVDQQRETQKDFLKGFLTIGYLQVQGLRYMSSACAKT